MTQPEAAQESAESDFVLKHFFVFTAIAFLTEVNRSIALPYMEM